MKVIDNIIEFDNGITLDINTIMNMKELMPKMLFSSVVISANINDEINDDEIEEAIELLEKQWLSLTPEDLESDEE